MTLRQRATGRVEWEGGIMAQKRRGDRTGGGRRERFLAAFREGEGSHEVKIIEKKRNKACLKAAGGQTNVVQ